MNLLEQQLVEIGFRKPRGNNNLGVYKYNFDENFYIAARCLGTGFEIVNLCKMELGSLNIIQVHSFEKNGRLSKEKIQYLINYFEKEWWW